MTNPDAQISELDLLAYSDGLLDPARRALVEAHLSRHPEKAAQVESYARQNREIRAHYGAACGPTPERLVDAVYAPRGTARRWRLPAAAGLAAAALLAVAVMGGWWAGRSAPDDTLVSFAHDIGSLHFQVEDEGMLADLAAPSALRQVSRELLLDLDRSDLAHEAFQIVGRHQLRRNGREVLQLTFRDDDDRQYSVFVTTRGQSSSPNYRLAEEGGQRIAYWADGPIVFAVASDAEVGRLIQFAEAVDRSVCTEDQLLLAGQNH